MRHQPTVEPPTPVSSALHPALQSALASLDIQLEEELARYRRLQAGAGRSPRSTNRRSQAKPLDLISISATGGRTDPARVNPSPSPAQATASHALVDTLRSLPYLNAPLPEQSMETATPQVATAPEVMATPVAELAIAVQPPESPLAADQYSSGHLSAMGYDDLTSPANPHQLEDYLESSEELLRSLAEKETEAQVERSFMQSLLTPLGAGSMVLLLLSSAMFGYVLMNPSSVDRVFTFNHAPSNRGPSGTTTPSNQPAAANPQPNLAAQEFHDPSLGSLATLDTGLAKPGTGIASSPLPGNLPSPANLTKPGQQPPTAPATGLAGGQAGPIVPPAPQVSQPASGVVSAPPAVRTYEPPHPARTSTAYQPAPTRVEPPAAITNQPSNPNPPKAIAPAPTASASSPGGGTTYPYKIVTPYSGDTALEAAKKVTPDAYVTNLSDGAYIQYGASHNEAEAELRARTLRDQGVPAEVIKK